MTTVTFRVATNNDMSLPVNPQFAATIDAAAGASVMMLQEADLPEYQNYLRHLTGHRVTHQVPADVNHAEFVLYDPTIWDHVSTEFPLAYNGHHAISHTRHLAVTVLHHKVLDRDFAFISYHAVTSGLDRIRQILRGEGDTAVRTQVRRFRAAGIPVILGADLNRVRKVFRTAKLWARHRIDHILAWDGTHVTLRLDSTHTVPTRSDHDIVVAEITATAT